MFVEVPTQGPADTDMTKFSIADMDAELCSNSTVFDSNKLSCSFASKNSIQNFRKAGWAETDMTEV